MSRVVFDRRWLLSLLLACVLFPSVTAFGQQTEKGIGDFPKLSAENDWPWWRGPSRNGIASETPVPTQLSETDNVVWKVPVPGRGHSSPTVVGNRIFLTTADDQAQIHFVLAFDRKTGKQLWKKEVNTGGFPAKNHAKNTEATATIGSDGERLFASFYHHDSLQATTLDFDGNILWQKNVGPFRPKTYEYGYAPSPLIYRGTVIYAAEYDGDSFIAALDRVTGEQKWKTPRAKNITFSSPVVTHISGKDQMLISGANQVASYSPNTGKLNWTTTGTTAATCGTMVWDADIVFASGGYPKAETLAVKADGSKVLWKNDQKCYEQSLLAWKGHVYALTDNGIMICWRGSDGKEMWKQRLTGPVSASPVMAGGHVYWANEMGTLYVFKPTPEKFDLVAENQIGNDSFPSPAICGGQIFLRVANRDGGKRQEFLYCFGK